jgi:hypothetical protein
LPSTGTSIFGLHVRRTKGTANLLPRKCAFAGARCPNVAQREDKDIVNKLLLRLARAHGKGGASVSVRYLPVRWT